jgi:hypothetical protein
MDALISTGPPPRSERVTKMQVWQASPDSWRVDVLSDTGERDTYQAPQSWANLATKDISASLSGWLPAQPSLSSQVIVLPSPATPVTPWSDSRQYSPGS